MKHTTRYTSRDEALDTLQGRAIMFDVLKGGYGKSAISFNLADRLGAHGYDVLYMDLDPNGHITYVLDYDQAYDDAMHDYGYVVCGQQVYSKANSDPEEMIYETEFNFDFVPSYNDMESFNAVLKNIDNSRSLLATNFLYPLIDRGEYDLVIMDGGGERSPIADNGFYSGRTGIIPLVPGEESLSAWQRTQERVIAPLSEVDEFDYMICPNMLSARLDHQTDDRRLLKMLNESQYQNKLAPFAQLSGDDWMEINANAYQPLPGIRKHTAISSGIAQGVPAAEHDPECSQIQFFDQLVEAIENRFIEGGS